jgi:hypothetical protein
MMERELAKLAEEEEVGLKSLQQFLEGTTIGDLLPSRPNVVLVSKEVTVEETLKVSHSIENLPEKIRNEAQPNSFQYWS